MSDSEAEIIINCLLIDEEGKKQKKKKKKKKKKKRKRMWVIFFFFSLDAGLLAKSQYPEGPATGHLDTSFSWFPCVYKQMLQDSKLPLHASHVVLTT